jgi:hypothetical protein
MSSDARPDDQRNRLYGVGTAKSGTHSIAAMFAAPVRARHEPDAPVAIRKILDRLSGRIRDAEFRRWVRARDGELNLDVDSSQLNFFLLDVLLEEFPAARFVLTIRDCYSWLDSYFNHSLQRASAREWIELRDRRFRPHLFKHPPEERVLKEHGLYTLDGYLSYWAEHNETVLRQVPAGRLLVVRTDEITPMAQRIAVFAGLPRPAVRVEQSHAFRASVKHRLLERIERSHLEGRVQQHCGELMRRFFPTIRLAAPLDAEER